MENRLSYALVGLFVFVLLIAGVFSVVWLGNYSHEGSFKFYNVATTESVSGLNEKAPVKLNGVNIGEVRKITINPQNAEEVLVVIRVQENAPIKEDTYALIQPQGITGLSFIQLQGSTNDSKPLKTGSRAEEYGLIHSQPSTFSRLDKTITSLSTKAEHLFDKAEQIVNEKNIQNLERILENSAKISLASAKTLETIEANNEEIAAILKQAVAFEKIAIEAATGVREMSYALRYVADTSGIDTMNAVKNAANSLARIGETLEEKAKKGAFDIDLLVKENLIPLQMALDELRLVSIETKSFIDHLNNSPSDLLFRSATVSKAPNE